MTLTLIVTLIGIGVVDSLNPSLFIAQLFLLTTPKPAKRTLAYIGGILVVNFLGGVLLLGGLRTLLDNWLNSIDLSTSYVAQVVIGGVLLAFGVFYSARHGDSEGHKPRSLRMWHAFLLGAVVMLNELTTALPYFLAIERIAAADVGAAGGLLALVIYNAVFSLPLFAFLGLFLIYHTRFMVQIERFSRLVSVWTPRVIKYGALIGGAVLALDGVLFLLTAVPLFG